MVRLITHNLLACHVKGCTSNNFPLALKDVQIELQEAEFNPEFVTNILPRLEWSALADAARQVEILHCRLNTRDDGRRDLLRNLHHVLLEVYSHSRGCDGMPNCKHIYPISNGIPNMVS
ncbi:hypothetical protein BKA82DRAFT_4175071 [Pisolithus tinctorius]|nr:hypothetical protein BKA82DRAFT_4175071 [Pisolithus tinctorius]